MSGWERQPDIAGDAGRAVMGKYGAGGRLPLTIMKRITITHGVSVRAMRGRVVRSARLSYGE